MKRKVRVLPEALKDLIETQRWYASRQPGLGQAFAEAIAEAVERIVRDPATFPCVHGAVRRLVMRRFPYAIYFRDVGNEILVIAVHGRQDPRRWQDRG
ncbi:MAG: type II toxin-antitoxin system RelE/ParE family toxin [Cyanobacteriota bacterium]